MLNDLVAFLLSIFVIEPFQSGIEDRLAQARAPHAVIAGIGTCASAALPVLTERLSEDWRWAVSSGVDIWTGRTPADAVLVEAVPQCRDAIAAARPFLASHEQA